MRRGFKPIRLTATLRRLIPQSLPITAGRIHFIRKVDLNGNIALLNETWPIGQPSIGKYVWATVDTKEQLLIILHKADPDAEWKCLKRRRFKLKQPVVTLLPAFRRKRPRCPDQWLT